MSERDETLAAELIAQRLWDPKFQKQVAVSRNRNTGNEDELIQDMRSMNDLEIRAKYGDEGYLASMGQYYTSNEVDRIEKQKRQNGEILDDTAIGVASGFSNTVGSLGSLLFAGAGKVDEYFDPENTGFSDLATITSKKTEDAVSWLDQFYTDEFKDRRELSLIEAELDAADNVAQYNNDTDNGKDSSFIDELSWFGRGTLNNLERLASDPAIAGDVVAQGIGSLGPSAKLAGVASQAVTGTNTFKAAILANAINPTRGTRLIERGAKAVEKSAIAASVGVSEASGVYSQTVNEILNMSHDQLMETSVQYQNLLENHTSEEAKQMLAADAGWQSFKMSFPMATGIGVVGGRFEAAPIGSFVGNGLVKSTRTVASQAGEESLQGLSGTVTSNLAIQEEVDPNRNTFENAPEEFATGLIAGAGMAGVMSAPATTVGTVRAGANTARSAADALFNETTYNDSTRQDIVGDSRARNAARTVGEGLRTAAEAAGPAIKPVVDRVAPMVNKARTRAFEVGGRVSEQVQEYANRPSSKEVTQSVKAAVNITEGLREAVETGQLEDTVSKIVSQPDTDTPSASFTDVAGGNNSLMDNIIGITAKMGSRKFRASNADTAYAAAQYQKLRSVVGSLPKDLRTKAGRILASKVAKDVSAKAEKLDLNRNPEEADVTTTVNVAKTNPANVNPDVADKILEESGEDLTPEEARYVRVASKIGRIVNRNLEKQVEIRTNENINLTQASRPKKRDLTVEGVSRQIHAEGKTDNDLKAKYRSINDFARDILSAVQSGEQTGAYPADATVINQKGEVVPVRQVTQQMSNFAQHMKNKVQALNDSVAESFTNKKGLREGVKKDYEGLVNGKFQSSSLGSNNLRGVFYSPDNPNSVAFAQQVAQDQNDLIEVYNTLRKEFPETFENMPAIEPVSLTPADTVNESEQPTGVEESSDPKGEEATSTSEDVDYSKIPQRVLMLAREGDLNRSQLTNKERKAMDNAGIYPNSDENYNVHLLEDIAQDRIQNKEWDPNVSLFIANNEKNSDQDRETQAKEIWENLSQERKEGELSEAFPNLSDNTIEKAAKRSWDQIPQSRKIQLIDQLLGENPTADEEVSDSENGVDETGATATDATTTGEELGTDTEDTSTSDGGDTAEGSTFPEIKDYPLYDGNASEIPNGLYRLETHVPEVPVNLLNRNPENLSDADLETVYDYLALQTSADEFHGGNYPDNVKPENTLEWSKKRGYSERSRNLYSKWLQFAEEYINRVGIDDAAGRQMWLEEQYQTGRKIYNTGVVEINNEAGLGETTGTTPVVTHPMLDEHYETRKTEAPLNSISDLENAEFNPEHVSVVRELLPELAETMNKRLKEHVRNGGRYKRVIDFIKDGLVQFTQFQAGTFVNPETKQYDNRIMDMAAIVITDFIATANPIDPNKLDDTLEDLGTTINEIDESMLKNILNSVPVSQLKDQLADDFIRLMNLKPNEQSAEADLQGIAQGFAAELLTALQKMKIVEFLKIESKEQYTYDVINPDTGEKSTVTETAFADSIKVNTTRLKELQDRIRSSTQKGVPNTVREKVFNEKREMYSIGKKIKHVPSYQDRGNVSLSELERNAIKQEQNIPHYVNEARLKLLEALGDGPLMRMLGWIPDAENMTHVILRKSAIGKNASIDKNIRDVVNLVGSLEGDVSQPIYYPIAISKGGRHHHQGPNAQTNKLLRMLATPTWNTLSFASKNDMDEFWLGVGQATGLIKPEMIDQEAHIKNIQEDFAEDFGPAVVMIKELLEEGSFDADAFATVVGIVDPEVLGAIESVASMEIAKENGESEFRMSQSFEMDGKTNGAANMMVNFGHGLFTPDEWENLKRVGLYLGKKGMTLNDYFKDKTNVDLYQTVSKVGDRMMALGGHRLKPWQKEQRAAAQRLAASIGNFEIVKNSDGTYTYKMTRETAKNPVTKVNYGSGVMGVAIGVADDMLLAFYEKLQTLTEETTIDDVFYAGFEQDMATMGLKLPQEYDENFVFPKEQVENFRKSIMFTIGRVLTDSTREVLGNRIQELNDMLVLSTNIQNRYLQKLFDRRVEQLAEHLANEGKIGRNKKGVPIHGQIPRAEWKKLEEELSQLGPIFVSDDQTLAIGGFQKKLTTFKFSSNFNERLKQPARMRRPDDVGVKAIPYIVIGTGDAMMMNLIFGSKDAPNDVLGIHDGVDVPVGKIKQYAPYVNQQVLKSWDRDVLAMPIMNFEGFLNSISDPDLLQEAESEVIGDFKKETVQTSNAADLLEQMQRRLRENRARKKVMKQMAVSVDQMGGSDVGFTRDGHEWDFHTVNQRIEREMEGRDPDAQEQVKTPVRVLTGKAVLENTRWTEAQKKVVGILKPLMGETRVVFGTLDQLNKWRGEHVAQDGVVLKAKGQYDAANDIVFMTTATGETLLHEMVHAATYNKVLAHYKGETNPAVERLEALMAQFMELDGEKKIREAQAAINRRLVKNTPVANANALNEFMAYALSSSQVRQKLEGTQANILASMKNKVIQLLRRVMGGVPSDMFSQVVFNTRVLNATPVDNGGNGSGGDDGGDGGPSESSGPFGEFTNYWIQNIKDYMAGLAETQDPKLMKTSLDLARAKRVLENLRQAGMLRNNKDKATFKAIYGIVLSDMKLNSNALIGLTKIFGHIEDNLSPEMFGTDSEAGNTYSAVLNALRESKEPSHAVAVLFALSQTSEKFRNALDQIPAPESGPVGDGSLNDFLTKTAAFTMQKLTGSMETNKVPADVLATVAGTIIDHDVEREFRVLKKATETLTAADEYVSGKFTQSADLMRAKNREVQASIRSDTQKYLVAAATFATNYLDKPGTDLTNKAAKRVTHMGIPFLSLVPIRELVSEMVGTDAQNKNVVALLDRVNASVSGMRQAFRQDLPVILDRSFKEAPTKEQWTSMFQTLAKTDFSRMVDLENMKGSMRFMEESGARHAEMQRIETQLQQSLSGSNFQAAIEKGRQLAAYMNGQSVGKLLVRNAYAIGKNLEGDVDQATIDLLDRWITLEAVDKMDSQTREETVRLWQEDPVGILGIVAYLQQLNEAEEAKDISEQARLNGYKGYIPNEGAKNVHITVALDEAEGDMERKGYKKLNISYTGETDSIFPRSYYVSTVRRQGIYSQGVVQNVAMTYRGVDVNTGLTVTGDTAGFISGEDGAIQRIMENQLDESVELENDQEALMPVFGPDGDIIGFERSISQEMIDTHMGRDENLAVMLGAWQGRQVEESLADQYNKQLADELKNIWDNREAGEEATFIDLSKTDDPIYKDSWSLIPQSTKLYMENLFGDDGVMVPKSMVNLSVGYREFSLADMWSGKTRLPKALQATVKGVSERFLGTKAMRILTGGEEILQDTVSTAKDWILIRSLVVPSVNLQANIVQLASRGVPVKTIQKSFRRKLAEVEEYNKNRTKIIELDAKKMLLARNDKQRQIIDDKIKVLEDLNQKMSIAPVLAAGAYKQLVEGLTEMDVEVSSGRIGEYMEAMANKVHPKAGDLAGVGLVSKSTQIYHVANRATQYGDFLAKSIYYDHLIEQGLSEDKALTQMNEEFVNYSVLPGRSRSALEGYGMLWFMAFKLRITKIAMQQLRDNPVRALAVNSALDVGSPVGDNIFTVIGENRLGYATGLGMMFNAPELNPWYNLMNR